MLSRRLPPEQLEVAQEDHLKRGNACEQRSSESDTLLLIRLLTLQVICSCGETDQAGLKSPNSADPRHVLTLHRPQRAGQFRLGRLQATCLAWVLVAAIFAPQRVAPGQANMPEAPLQVTTVPFPKNASGGMTMGPDGQLYLSDFGSKLGPSTETTQVYRLDPRTGSWSVFASGFQGASGCCFDSAGIFYQANPRGHRISRRTADGKLELDWAREGLKTPIGVVANKQGHLFVCNCGDRSISKISPQGAVTRFAQSKQLNCPNGLTIDEQGILYACNFNDGKVLKIDTEGRVTVLAELPVLRGGPTPVGNGHLTYHNGQLYVATIGTGQIFAISRSGEVRWLAGKPFAFHNQDGPADKAGLNKPNGIAISADGRYLYVLCSQPTWPQDPQGLHPTVLRKVGPLDP